MKTSILEKKKQRSISEFLISIFRIIFKRNPANIQYRKARFTSCKYRYHQLALKGFCSQHQPQQKYYALQVQTQGFGLEVQDFQQSIKDSGAEDIKIAVNLKHIFGVVCDKEVLAELKKQGLVKKNDRYDMQCLKFLD